LFKANFSARARQHYPNILTECSLMSGCSWSHGCIGWLSAGRVQFGDGNPTELDLGYV